MPPAIDGKILVTGASGFIGAWVIRTLLAQKFQVRGAVRTKAKGEYLRSQFNKGFEFAIVPDITVPGAFDQVLEGCSGVIHIASPVAEVYDPEKLIGPAVKGTTSILHSVASFGKDVKRFVLTSSTGCILPNPFLHGDKDTSIGKTFTEEDHNNYSVPHVEKYGKESNPLHSYKASKVLAEKAAWDFMKGNQDLKFDLTTVHPTIVFGPFIQEATNVNSLNLSMKLFLKAFLPPPEGRTDEELVAANGYFVDVRDVANAHVQALKETQAAGERIIVSYDKYTYQDFLDMVRDAGVKDIPKGLPGAGKDVKPSYYIDYSKSEQMLGLKYTDPKETVLDAFKCLRRKGWC